MEERTGSFEQALEVDIRRLASEVKEHREQPEMVGAGDRELIKKALQTMTDDTQQPSPAMVKNDGSVIQNPLPDYAASAPAETKLEIEYLLELVFHKGILAANKEARKSSAFVLDAFHDALAGKLYPELQKREIVK